MWTFEKFFNEVSLGTMVNMTNTLQVTNLLGKKKVYVYYINKLSQLRVYLDRTQVSPCSLYSSTNLTYLPNSLIYQTHLSAQHLEHLQLLLTEQTDVEPGSQILLLNVL